MYKPFLNIGKVNKTILLTNFVITAVYLSWWFNPMHIGNPYLYGLLFFGEIYHTIMAASFWSTIWPRKKQKSPYITVSAFTPSVDVYIPVAGEPVSVIRETVRAAKNMRYLNKKIYILNDGFVAKKDNWHDVELMALEEGVGCITRKTPGGAKAGNINNAMLQTSGEIIVIFDADMTPYPEFLERVIPYFNRDNVGFVQTPQYYKNNELNNVTGGAWEQQAFFFGPILAGKGKQNAAFICGTNVAIRRKALVQAGGMSEASIAEDFLTSLFIHQKGWKSHYISDVLSEGLAPEDLQSYFNQQLRWARGSLEILFTYNPLFKRGLSWKQKIEYLSSALYYFNGVVLLIDMIMPLIFLFTGIQPVAASTTSFAIFFIPFMIMNLYTLYLASDGSFTFRAISFSQSSFALQIMAIVSVLLKRKMSFKVTSKQALEGNFIHLAFPHIFYTFMVFTAFGFSLHREGMNPSVMTNFAWAFFNVIMFSPFISSAVNFKPARNDVRIAA